VLFTGTSRDAAAKKPTADPRVRHALSLAIDRKQILDSLLSGKGSLPTTPWNTLPSSADIDVNALAQQATEAQRYDPAEAKKLLAEAGYAGGFSDIKMFQLSPVDTPQLPQVTEAVVAQWKKIGVNAKVVVTDYGNYRPHFIGADPNDSYNAGDAFTYGAGARFDALGALTAYFRNKGGNAQLINDPAFDKLVDQVAVTIDDKKRAELVTQAFQKAADQWVALPLFNEDSLYGINPKTVGNWQVYEGWGNLGRVYETVQAP
jgi:peptide/nickel transport system substrate-binding protein